jgi:RNA polymerase sigma-70 factor (ECF subfamily)
MSTLDRPNRTQDEWIVLRCQAGEHNAFEDLVALMDQPLLYYATKLTGNAETALDVLQDVWMKVFRRIGRLKDPDSLRPWLYRITHGMAVELKQIQLQVLELHGLLGKNGAPISGKP